MSFFPKSTFFLFNIVFQFFRLTHGWALELTTTGSVKLITFILCRNYFFFHNIFYFVDFSSHTLSQRVKFKVKLENKPLIVYGDAQNKHHQINMLRNTRVT